MKTITSDDYIVAIKRRYEQQKTGKYASFLLVPTTAQLRDLCLHLFDRGLTKADEEEFLLFFNAESRDELRRAIMTIDVDKFRAIKNFLVGKSGKTNPQSMNLIAVMVGLENRPLIKFMDAGNAVSDQRETSKKDEEPETESINEGVAQNTSGKITVSIKPERKYIVLMTIGVLMLFGGYIIKKEAFPTKECMQWKDDHYEEVVCEGKKIGFAAINPIFDRNEELLDFKRIKVSASTTFFKDGQPVVWYIKQDGKCEYFNAPGLHPISGKPLRPVSKHIVSKYVLKE